jgi:hypothetical protein
MIVVGHEASAKPFVAAFTILDRDGSLDRRLKLTRISKDQSGARRIERHAGAAGSQGKELSC